MNNALIKELMFKAGDVPLPGLIANFDDNSWIVKYTEMVVRECSRIAAEARSLELDFPGDYIESHFGVEW